MGMANNDPNWRAVAGEALLENDAVYIKAADGLAWKANAAGTALTDLAVGFCPQAAAVGARIPVIRQGTLSEIGSAATAGAITLTPPSGAGNRVQRVGYVRYEDVTTMLIDIVDRAVTPTG
jgi:predicted transcriptional regulator